MDIVGLILSALDSAETSELEEGLLNAAYLLEKSTLRPSGGSWRADDESMGWPPAIRAYEPTPSDVTRVRDRLVGVLEGNREGPVTGTAIWALGKARDQSVLPVFERILAKHLAGDPDVLYQAIIAIQNLGVKIPHSTATSSDARTRENRAAVSAYLAYGLS